MKKVILIGISCLVIASIAGYLLRPKNTGYISDSADQGIEDVILLYPEKGEVYYKSPKSKDFTLATTSSIGIPAASFVRTGTSSLATVLLPDNSSITLKENTEIQVQYGEKGTSIFQSFGMTYHRVEKLVLGRTYQVQTPSTLAAVRGTKFGVEYNKVTKETKVAVTEHEVEVSEIKEDKNATSSEKELETVRVSTGMMAVVDEKINQRERRMTTISIEKDKVMNSILEEEKKKDKDLNLLKEEVNEDKPLLRKELKKMMERKEFQEEVKKEEVKKDESLEKKNDVINKEVIKETERDTITKTSTESPRTSVTVPVVAKPLDEEAFFSQFEPLFIDLFYVEDGGNVCSFNGSALDRVNKVKSFAKTSGYPIENGDLLTFATKIEEYCKTKDISLKSSLQKRFDEEYPYR